MVTLSLSINDFQKNYGEVAFEACSLLARTQGDFSVGCLFYDRVFRGCFSSIGIISFEDEEEYY